MHCVVNRYIQVCVREHILIHNLTHISKQNKRYIITYYAIILITYGYQTHQIYITIMSE